MYILRFYFIICLLWSMYLRTYFFDVVRNQASNKNYLLRLIKRRPKVHEKATSRKHALNNQWKTFTKNYKSVRVWLWFVSKITMNNYRPRLLAEFIETQERYSNSLNKISNLNGRSKSMDWFLYDNGFRLERVKTICHIKPKQTFLVNLTLWEVIIPCETSHICRCNLKIIEKKLCWP